MKQGEEINLPQNFTMFDIEFTHLKIFEDFNKSALDTSPYKTELVHE